MKKIFIALSVAGFAQIAFAQESFTPQYVEELQQYNNGAGNLSGTARYKGLSGAMSALGGDLSAVNKNPASAAVFLNSEAVATIGIHSAKTEVDNGSNFSESEFALDQIGAVMTFKDLSSSNWKNVALTMNYQQQDYVNEKIDASTTLPSTFTNREVQGVFAEKYGTSSTTNVSIAGNYQNRLYIGGGLNFHTFETESIEALTVYEQDFDATYDYVKDFSPNARQGEGVSVGLGVIAKINQQLRLGVSYQSPKWYREVEEAVAERAMFLDSDSNGDYYYTDVQDYDLFVHDLNSGQKFTGSLAYVIGTNGFISADYTYTDNSSAKFLPEDSFAGENNFLSNQMKGSNAISIGAEAVLQDFTLRGGYRYEQTPFDEVNIGGINGTYQPFGDLTGYSVGVGYEMNGFFIDASYDFFSRDRHYLIYGNYYDPNSTAPADVYTQDEALDILSFNANEIGVAHSIKDITEKQGNISLSVGLRF